MRALALLVLMWLGMLAPGLLADDRWRTHELAAVIRGWYRSIASMGTRSRVRSSRQTLTNPWSMQ
jgi:hypothetical protein